MGIFSSEARSEATVRLGPAPVTKKQAERNTPAQAVWITQHDASFTQGLWPLAWLLFWLVVWFQSAYLAGQLGGAGAEMHPVGNCVVAVGGAVLKAADLRVIANLFFGIGVPSSESCAISCSASRPRPPVVGAASGDFV